MTALTAWGRTGYLPVVPSAPSPEPPVEPDPPTTPAPPAWVDHPGTDASINQLLVSGGRLHIAHGSWFGGNHRIVWADLDGTPHTGPLAPSEGFAVVREYGGTIFLPWQDPTGAWNAPQGYSYTTDGTTWRERRVAPAAHIFDLREHDGILYLAGSGSGVANVWASQDSGQTWQDSLTLPGDPAPRTYHIAEAGGTLWCRPHHVDNPATYRLDAGQWVPDPAPLPDLDGYASGLSVAGVSYGIRSAFDGYRLVDYSTEVRGPGWADGTHVYAVNQSTGHIDRAPHLTPGDTEVTWTPWFDLGEGMTGHVATTAILHDGYVYVGGTQGRIWRFDAPA